MANVTGGCAAVLLLAADMLSNAITDQLHLHLLVLKPPVIFVCIKKLKTVDTCN
jgi:hypothetical protein